MGASASARLNGGGPDDATGEEQTVEVIEVPEGEDADAKLLQKNGQISGLNGKTDDATGDFGSQAGDKEPKEVGQTDSVSQKEDVPEMMEALQGEAAPEVDVKKPEKVSADTDELTSMEKASEEQKLGEANEVGFKKIFRFVGFKVTLKKDKSEKDDPVQLLTVKKEEGEAGASDATEGAAVEESVADGPVEGSKEEDAADEDKKEPADQESTENGVREEIKLVERERTPENPQAEEAIAEASESEVTAEKIHSETEEQTAETVKTTQEVASEKETEVPAESPTSPPVQETQSPLKRFFTQGIFSNLRKKTSLKKSKEEELLKEVAVKEEIKETTEETTQSPNGEGEEVIKETIAEAQQEQSTAAEESNAELLPEVPDAVVKQKEDEIKAEIKVEADTPQTTPEEVTATLPAEGAADVMSTEEKTNDSVEGQASQEEVPAAVTTEAELLSSQEKNKIQGSPLKKLLTGSGLKKLSSKKHKGKKEVDANTTESGEQISEQLQSSSESADGQKGESSPSSPEESAEHVIGEPSHAEASPENESEGDKKKDGILPWASFKKLVTPKRRVKKSSESEDDVPEKPKSATLSSTDSAVFVEKLEEPKPAEEEQKTEPITEEPKKKMDTSVSWEALICVGSSKKRARKTSDSDDETPRIEEEHPKTGEALLGSSQEADHENLPSSPEQAGSPSEGDGVSTWESLKRFVTPRRKAKVEEKAEEPTAVTTTEQIPSDTEIPKEESSFSLKKLIPGRKKKKSDAKHEQVSSDEAGKSLGSAEEDSDTPAVVPLSEYDSEQVEQDVTSKDTVAAMETPAGTEELTEESKLEAAVPESEEVKLIDEVAVAGAQLKAVADVEERLPSWISATAVEDIQETTERITKQPLSDIPEEGDTIATPKSTAEEASRDDTIAEDIVELTCEVTTAVEQVPEVSFTEETTEMVSAVSRLTESPGTSGDATPVQAEYDMEKTEAVLQEAVQTIIITEHTHSLITTDLQQESVAVSVTPQVMESALKEEMVTLVLHAKSEATAICTGLDSQEIESAEEKTLQTSVERTTEVGEVVSTEMVVEDKNEKSAIAAISKDSMFVAEVLKIKTESAEPKPLADVEETPKQVEVEVEAVKGVQENAVLLIGEVKRIPDHEYADMLQDEKPVDVVSVSLTQGEVLEQAAAVAENASNIEMEGPLEAKEESVVAQIAQITEASFLKADAEQEFEGFQEDVAQAEVTPLEGVKQCVIQEVSASIPELPTAQISDIQEAPIAVAAPAVELLVSEETTCVIKPLSESVPFETAEIKNELEVERVASQKSTDDHDETCVEISTAQTAVETVTEPASVNMSSTFGVVSVKGEEIKVMQAEQIQEAETVKEDCTAVAEVVIQKVDLKATESEQIKEAEHIEESVAEVVIQNMVDDLPTEDSGSGEEKEVVPEGLKAEEEAPAIGVEDEKVLQDKTDVPVSGGTEVQGEKQTLVEKLEKEPPQPGPEETEQDVKEKTEDPKEKVHPEQYEKMDQEAVGVETSKISQSEAVEGLVVPAGIHQADISIEHPAEIKQEVGVPAKEEEAKTQEEQAGDTEGSATQDKGEDESKTQAVIVEEKSEAKADTASQEKSIVADTAGCQDDQLQEAKGAKELVHHEAAVLSDETSVGVDSDSQIHSKDAAHLGEVSETEAEMEPSSETQAQVEDAQVPGTGESRQTETMEEIQSHIAVASAEGREEACDQETAEGRSDTVEKEQVETAVESAVKGENREVEEDLTQGAVESRTQDHAVTTAIQDAEVASLKTCSEECRGIPCGDGAASEEPKLQEKLCQEPPMEAVESQEDPADDHAPEGTGTKDDPREESVSSSETEAEAKDVLEKGQPAAVGDVIAEAVKTIGQVVVSETLGVTEEAMRETTNELDSVASQQSAAS